MKVTPLGAPTPQTQANTQQDSRQRAMAAFNQAQTAPVANPTAVSPEEMGAIKGTEARQTDSIQDVATAVETAPQAPEVAAPKDPALEAQFQQLAKQERLMRQKAQQADQALKAREQAIAAREAALAPKAEPTFDPSQYIPKDRLKQDALGALADVGVSWDDLTQRMLNQTPTDPRVEAQLRQMAERADRLEKIIEDQKTQQVDAQKQQYQNAVAQITRDVANLVKTDAAFETIKASNATADVVKLIEETFNKEGILLSIEEAAQQVEDYLVDEALKLAKLSKIQKRLQPATAAATSTAQQTASAKPAQTQPMKTLTNTNSVPARKLTNKERAMRAFKGEPLD